MLGTRPVSKLFAGQLTQVVDDVSILKNALAITDTVIAQFRKIGVHLDGPKMKVLVPPSVTDLKLPQSLSQANVVRQVHLLLGGIVTLSNGVSNEMVDMLLNDWFQTKVTDRIARILSLPTGKHNKLLLLQTVSRWFTFHASTFHLPDRIRQKLFDRVQLAFVNAFCQVFAVELSAESLVHIIKPTQDSGFGIHPISMLHSNFLLDSVLACRPYLQQLGIHLAPPTTGRKPKWDDLFTETDVRRPTDYHGVAWLSARPTSKFIRLDDDTMSFAVHYRLGTLHALSFVCPQTNTQLHLSGRQLVNHFDSCKTCGKVAWDLRHDRVCAVIVSALTFHNVAAKVVSHDFSDPLVGENRGGHDVSLYRPHGTTTRLDVAVVMCQSTSYETERRKNTRFVEKLNKYAETSIAEDSECIPFVLDTSGMICCRTVDVFQRLMKGMPEVRKLCCDVFAFASVACMRGIYDGYKVFLRCATRAARDD